MTETPRERSPWRRRLRRLLLAVLLAPVAYYLFCLVALVVLKWVPPPLTGVQAQRVVERLVDGERPLRQADWVAMERLPPALPRAVVAAEDSRFFQHDGFDWAEIQAAREEARRSGDPIRGASTLTQQLLKNLFFTTHRNPARKLYEWALTPPAEWILGKDRILELYLNVVEFGPGVFGVEAGAQHHFGISAQKVGRGQAQGLAAILPAPLRRRPGAMGWYVSIIDARMRQMGW